MNYANGNAAWNFLFHEQSLLIIIAFINITSREENAIFEFCTGEHMYTHAMWNGSNYHKTK